MKSKKAFVGFQESPIMHMPFVLPFVTWLPHLDPFYCASEHIGLVLDWWWISSATIWSKRRGFLKLNPSDSILDGNRLGRIAYSTCMGRLVLSTKYLILDILKSWWATTDQWLLTSSLMYHLYFVSFWLYLIMRRLDRPLWHRGSPGPHP